MAGNLHFTYFIIIDYLLMIIINFLDFSKPMHYNKTVRPRLRLAGLT